MDSGSKNVLKQLDERIDKLRSLGVERGLSISEIDDCILKCVNGEINVKNATKRKGSSRSRQRQLCYSAFGVCAGFWAVVAGLYVLSEMHAPTANFFTSVMQPFVYPFLRNVRLVGLPVLRRYDMTVYYDEECLIDNPYYSPNPPACETCEDVEEIKSKHYSSITVSDDPDTEPLLLTGGFDPVSLHKLMEHCRNYEQELGEGVHLFKSTSSHIRALGPFLNLTEEEAQADPKFHVIWHTRMVAPARVLRTIYKRPAFIAYQHEVGLEKTVLIDSPNAESYSVPLGGNPYAWYVQSSGHRRLVLMPKPECASKCQSFQITMKPGEMLYIFTDPWTLTSMPLIGGEDGPIIASVAFVGTFNSE